MGQGGNAWEREETDFDLVNGPSEPDNSERGIRGGVWGSSSTTLLTGVRAGRAPDTFGPGVGFRVASVAIPEPTTTALALAAGLCIIGRRRRR